MKIAEKIKNFLDEKIELILFIIVFSVVCFVYNLNLQTINYTLKRGTSLIYSYDTSKDNFKENILNELNNLNIKYNLLDEENISQYDEYDNDLNKIEKIFSISIPFQITKNNTWLFDKISNCVFDNFNNAKLILIRPLNSYYHVPYYTFRIYAVIFLSSFVIWMIFLICFRRKKIINRIKNIFKNNKNKSDDNVKKDFKYFLKKIFLDEDKADDENANVTYEIISTILFVLVCVVIIRYFIGELRWIPSGSMRPTIVEHDRVFVEKLDYPTKKQIQRGDILVFYPPSVKLSSSPLKILARLTGIFCKDIAYIKRVVGMPGDKFQIIKDFKTKQYKVFINDKPLDEPYISSPVNWTECTENMYCGPFIIPDNNYFMMGDNRNNSQDSRFWGFLDKKRIIGRANFMFFPFSRINVLRDKYFLLQKNKFEKELYILDRY